MAPATRATSEGLTTNRRRFIVGMSVAASPDVWQSAANVALVLSILGLGIVPAAWLILTTPEVEQ
jgi:hypothetical protein